MKSFKFDLCEGCRMKEPSSSERAVEESEKFDLSTFDTLLIRGEVGMGMTSKGKNKKKSTAGGALRIINN
jgi:hypothetical protein